MTDYQRKSALERIVEHYGAENQLNIAQEEMAEVIQAISKVRRQGIEKSINDIHSAPTENLKEEIADGLIMLNQLMLIFHFTPGEINSLVNYKIHRQQCRMENEGQSEGILQDN